MTAPLAALLSRVLELLKRTQPIEGETDVAWWGPYFIPRPRLWCPSHFTIYRGALYARVFIPPSSYGLSWRVGSGNVDFERGLSSSEHDNGEALWTTVLAQLERRLCLALLDFGRYNRWVERLLPPSCRSGKLRRRLSWPRNAKGPLPLRAILGLEKSLCAAGNRPLLSEMTLNRYLATAAVAYDAVFKDLRPLPPPGKYRRKADGRHGGLLDLPPEDAKAFARWFRSKRWAGAHPWEIVFGHPHGIMLSPRNRSRREGWRYSLWVDSPGWYADAARMALALASRGIPFEFIDHGVALDALKGIDEVDIGPDLYAIHFDELKKERPDAVASIRWDPVPRLAPVSEGQAERIARGLMPDGRGPVEPEPR